MLKHQAISIHYTDSIIESMTIVSYQFNSLWPSDAIYGVTSGNKPLSEPVLTQTYVTAT